MPQKKKKNFTIQLLVKENLSDIAGLRTATAIQKQLGCDTGCVKSSKVFSIDYELSPRQLSDFAHLCLQDTVVNEVYIDSLYNASGFSAYIAIAKLPGVTDDEGISAQKSLADFLNEDIDTHRQHIFSQDVFYIEKPLPENMLRLIAEQLLGNKLINYFTCGLLPQAAEDRTQLPLYVPEVKLEIDSQTDIIDLNISDEDLVLLSKKQVLALNLAEMKAIQQHYNAPQTQADRQAAGMPWQPTDCELEVIAQTWSEHCKHKEFNAHIDYTDVDTGHKKQINSLFKTYIKGATDKVAQSLTQNGNHWLVKVFSDNAGVVRFNAKELFVWKVETHNSPSALDPYGGAITGILGNNRDPLGTGIGGAKLLFNTNVLCFGPPDYNKPLLNGQLHPQRILAGVRHGIEDGGNKSGIPTVNGAIVFDERYSGKPLVYCGTGAILPPDYNGLPTWEKNIDVGDLILMAGGRVGKDGIHGATFSSIEIDEHSPASAVQIGSPITQKLLADFLVRACEMGLVKCSTDNGAGGLSSSIGELATLSGGAEVHLDAVPLKYSGLKPWEIFVSESQERMTLVATPQQAERLYQLADYMEVELTQIGIFTQSGRLDVRFDNKRIAYIDMHFLHEGVPLKYLEAVWQKPNLQEPSLPYKLAYNDVLLKLMKSYNICSREYIIRQYDHEVKGKTIIKPLMGEAGKTPQDAAVMRLNFESYEGVAISNGILPRYGDIDAYQMSAGAFDEGIRQIIAVGGQLPNQSFGDNIAWSVNDNFCVPDSVFDAQGNADGKEKLAKLVQMCEALYDMAVFFDIPLTSGKDSMKNDFKADGQKISVPPTVLYSMAAKIPDIRRTVCSNFKAVGDAIFLLGTTYDEMGASEFYRLLGQLGTNVPKVRKKQAKDLYLKVMAANNLQLIESCHDLSDGGFAVALVECVLGNQTLGVEVSLDSLNTELSTAAVLFSESHSRFVCSISPENTAKFEELMGSNDAHLLGYVTDTARIVVQCAGETLIDLPTKEVLQAWESGLSV